MLNHQEIYIQGSFKRSSCSTLTNLVLFENGISQKQPLVFHYSPLEKANLWVYPPISTGVAGAPSRACLFGLDSNSLQASPQAIGFPIKIDSFGMILQMYALSWREAGQKKPIQGNTRPTKAILIRVQCLPLQFLQFESINCMFETLMKGPDEIIMLPYAAQFPW